MNRLQRGKGSEWRRGLTTLAEVFVAEGTAFVNRAYGMRDEWTQKRGIKLFQGVLIKEASGGQPWWNSSFLFFFFPLSLFCLMSPVFLRADWKRAAQHVEREGSLASNGLSKGHQAHTQTVLLLALAETSSISSHENITPR